MRKLINASNLHQGGAVQVATSYLFERKRANNADDEKIIISTSVSTNLKSLRTELGPHWEVVNSAGILGLSRKWKKCIREFDAVFTIFGPLYMIKAPFLNIVGFAQPWIIYPDNECYSLLPLRDKIKTKIKYWLQGKFFRRADIIIVELEHVKEGLIRELRIPPERIRVIHNCISQIYRDETLWRPAPVPECGPHLRLGYVGRNYLHKNLKIFPIIINDLKHRHGIDAKVYVTLNRDEWMSLDDSFRGSCINVGPINADQCPDFYRKMDAILFPSLLECFSAMPLEALAMRKPLFASDRQFNKDICGPHAHYFDPTCPLSAANKIAEYFSEDVCREHYLDAAMRHAFNFSNSAQRAALYDDVLSQLNNK